MPDKIKLTSPLGLAVFPWLAMPDTKFNEHGTYQCNLKVDPSDPDVKAHLDHLRDAYKAHIGKAPPAAKNSLFMRELDDDGEETGMVIIKAVAKNVEIKKGKRAGEIWDRQPKVWDSKGNAVKPIPNIGGGSKVRLNYETYPTVYQGVPKISLQLSDVQLIELVEFDGSQGNPFDVVDDGYEVEQESSPFADDEGSASDATDY